MGYDLGDRNNTIKELAYFVDEQRLGPFRIWHHQHHFKALPGGGVEMTDIVDYRLPFGVLGKIVHFLFVKKQVESIFEFRNNKLLEIFK